MHLSRDQVWSRLVSVDYFDWCRKAQLKRLEGLFFDGEIVSHAEDYLLIRELSFHPLHTPEQWTKVIELRKVVNCNDFDEVVESAGRFYISERITELLKEDVQFAGMSVASQIELAEFLGAENQKPYQQSDLIAAYLGGIAIWLKGENTLPWDSARFSENKFAVTKGYLYQLINESLLIYKGRHILLSEPVRGWKHSYTTSYLRLIKIILKCAESYKLPKKIETDPGPRLAFLEGLREDLELRRTPKLILDVWDAMKKD